MLIQSSSVFKQLMLILRSIFKINKIAVFIWKTMHNNLLFPYCQENVRLVSK